MMFDRRWIAAFLAGMALAVLSDPYQESKFSTSTQFCGSDDCFNETSLNETTTREEINATEYIVDTNTNEEIPATEKVTTETTVAQTLSTSTSATLTVTTRQAPPLFETNIRPNEPCSCDATNGSCDVNCCCDVDCDESDKKTFSRCMREVTTVRHSGLCYKERFIYTNNTRYKIMRQESGLFCISRDNFPERMFFSDQKIIKTTSSFNRAMKRKEQYTWTEKTLILEEQLDSTMSYKSGTAVWIYSNVTGSLSTLEIPLTSGTTFCKSSRTVRYLEEFDSRCLYLLISKENCSSQTESPINAQLFCEHLTLVTSPLLVNRTNIAESSDDAFVELRKLVCYRNDTECNEIKRINAPSYDRDTNSCLNAVTSVEYIVYHNSTNGIVDAECLIQLASVQLGQQFSQQYRVSFQRSKNYTGLFLRSGMPGYLQGKPLISGKLVHRSLDPLQREMVNMSQSASEWFSVPVANKHGACSGMTNVLFKENFRTQCELKITRDALLTQDGCNSVKEEIWMTIFGGMKLNQSDPRQLQTFVSAFGDPTPESSNDWVPIFFDRSPMTDQPAQVPCPTQIAGVQYKVLYSYIGPFSSPQMKIIGLYASLTMRNVACKVHSCELKIVSVVNFLDVSQQAVNKFAKAPIVKIRLPPDFFYPFSSSNSWVIDCNNSFLCLIVVLLKVTF